MYRLKQSVLRNTRYVIGFFSENALNLPSVLFLLICFDNPKSDIFAIRKVGWRVSCATITFRAAKSR